VKEGALDVIKVDVFRRIRRERGLSQTALAKASGVAQTTISGIEKGAQTSSKHLPKMAAALDVAKCPHWTMTTPRGHGFPQRRPNLSTWTFSSA
jgi:DNA-binding XRE family transcriptional regulator